ncbi:Tetraspanin-2 [Vitis vinifera]|uniref:Tetraspanin-2 n=1 Tax=Vitis vinifera TaxID=29760 RepID=A0A438JBW4_VITVI|nr:Tetraspanin-2 [Vitis vinifera]
MAVVAINLQQINDAATTQAWLCRNPEALPLFSTNHRCHHRPPLTFPILPSSCIKDNLVVEVHSGMRKGVSGESPRLQQFSDWLQMNVVDRQNWLGIKACLSETKICSSQKSPHRRVGYIVPLRISCNKELFFLQNGCCKPPAHCGYKLKNGTVWTVPSSGLASRDHDCIMWSSEPNTLCYDCESCKAGVLSRIQEDWWRLSIVACCLIAFLVINFMVGCCAFRSTRAFDKYQRCGYQS